jgi:hypothetical protein
LAGVTLLAVTAGVMLLDMAKQVADKNLLLAIAAHSQLSVSRTLMLGLRKKNIFPD